MQGKLLPAFLSVLILIGSCTSQDSGDQFSGLPGVHEDSAQILGESGIFPLEDSLQSQEDLDGNGNVLAPRDTLGLATGVDEVFSLGRAFHLQTGSVSTTGLAARIQSTYENSASVLYRLKTGGRQPALLSVYCNLPLATAGLSTFHVAIADFSAGRWRWFGPFDDAHIRIPLPVGQDHTSELGNVFATVLVNSGSGLEVVGLGLELRTDGDSQGPSAPTGLIAQAVNGGVLLGWDQTEEEDIAGWAVHHAAFPFDNPGYPGVVTETSLLLSPGGFLALPAGVNHLALSAMDHAGNTSPASAGVKVIVSGSAAAPVSVLPAVNFSHPGGLELATTAGAALFDIDLDGDGVFEVLDYPFADFMVPVAKSGLLLTRVRGHDLGELAYADNGLCIISTPGNLPPFAQLDSNLSRLAQGEIVSLDAGNSVDLDGTITQFKWDLDADGTFETDSSGSAQISHSWSQAGFYQVGLRVTDELGASSTAYRSITVLGGLAAPVVDTGMVGKLELLLLEGNPAVIFTDETSGSAFCTVAQDPAWTTWNLPVSITDQTVEGSSLAAALVYNMPAVVYSTTDEGRPYFCRASMPDGSLWSDPILIHNIEAGYRMDLTMINGFPQVQYTDQAGEQAYYSRATSQFGSSWFGPYSFSNGGRAGQNPLLLSTPIGPLVMFSLEFDVSSVVAFQSGDPDGISWQAGSWISDLSINDGYYLDAVSSSSALFAGYVANPAGDSRIMMVSNVPANGTQWSLPQTVASGSDLHNSRIEIIRGLPTVVYEERGDWPRKLIYIRARDSYGYAWDDRIVIATHTGTRITSLDVLELDKRAVVAYADDAAGQLFFGTVFD